MSTRDWLAEWNRRYARLLIEAETPAARAALVDTNGDGRELWFALDVRSHSGDWDYALDWDDVGGHHPAERLEGLDVIFGWGTGHARERRLIEFDGHGFPIRVGSNGWWLLLAHHPRGAARPPSEPR